MGTTRRYHHGDLREALLSAALDRIEAVGVEGFSLRDASRALGVSEAAPYHHFRGRDELLVALAVRGYARLGGAMAQARCGAGAAPLDQLAAIGRAYVRFALDHPGLFRAIFGPHMVALAGDAELFAAGRVTWDLLGEVASACSGATTPAPRELARTSWALVHGLAVLLNGREIRPEEDPSDVDGLIDAAMAVLVRGLSAPAP